MSRAPCTLAAAAPGGNGRRGAPRRARAAASAIVWPDSAREARPRTTTTLSPLADRARRAAARRSRAGLARGCRRRARPVPPRRRGPRRGAPLAGEVGEGAARRRERARSGEHSIDSSRRAPPGEGAGTAPAALRGGRRRAARRRSAAQASSMLAWGRPSTASAGRPSASWASTASVPRTDFGELGQGVGVLVGEPGPPITAIGRSRSRAGERVGRGVERLVPAHLGRAPRRGAARGVRRRSARTTSPRSRSAPCHTASSG